MDPAAHADASVWPTDLREGLRRHAAAVDEVVRAAAELGRICIVTLAEEAWVWRSIHCLMPGMEATLRRYSVEVVSARACAPRGLLDGGDDGNGSGTGRNV